MYSKFTGWYPDFDPTTPDTLLDGSNNIVPTNRGYRGFNSLLPLAAQTSLSATAVGLWWARRVTLADRLLVGTSTQIFEKTGGAWSAMIPAAITVSAVSRWQFAQVGDITIAGSKDTQPLQFESVSASTIAMPRFACIDTVGEFVFVGNVLTSTTFSGGGINQVLPGDHPDRWWCSALGDYSSWTPSGATQATTNRLLDVAGPITCVRKLGEQIAIYKERGIWVGSNTGPPWVWSFALPSTEIGTFGQNCVVPVGSMHYFVGIDNFYAFDGTVAKPIGEGVREWFFTRLNAIYASRIIGVQDQYNSLILWWYPGPNSPDGTLDECIVYNYETGRWGTAGNNAADSGARIQIGGSFITDEVTWDELWAGLSWDATPNVAWDLIAYKPDQFVPIVVTGNFQVATLFGVQLDSTLRISWFGEDIRTSLVRMVRPRWIGKPTRAYLTPYRMMVQGDLEESETTRTMTLQSRFAFTQNARWHSWKIATRGNWESPGADNEIVKRGRE